MKLALSVIDKFVRNGTNQLNNCYEINRWKTLFVFYLTLPASPRNKYATLKMHYKIYFDLILSCGIFSCDVILLRQILLSLFLLNSFLLYLQHFLFLDVIHSCIERMFTLFNYFPRQLDPDCWWKEVQRSMILLPFNKKYRTFT